MVDHLLEQAEMRNHSQTQPLADSTTSRLNHSQTQPLADSSPDDITVDLPLEQARRLQAMPASLLPRPASLDDLD